MSPTRPQTPENKPPSEHDQFWQSSPSGIQTSSDVYGSSPLYRIGRVSGSTPHTPTGSFGDSKYLARRRSLASIRDEMAESDESLPLAPPRLDLFKSTATQSSPDHLEHMLNALDVSESDPYSGHYARSGEDPFKDRVDALTASSCHGSPSAPPLVDSNAATSPASTMGDNVEITAENAQSLLLPQACVFVANLARGATDDALRAAVTEAFKQFGECWVKVLRNPSNQMPSAFVQFKTSEEAMAAVGKGRGIIIFDRPCRTEVARANRAIYVTRHDGLALKREDVIHLLSPFGEIETVVFPTATDLHMHDLPAGAWAHFKIFGECKDALQTLQHHQIYHVRQAKDRASKSLSKRATPSTHRDANVFHRPYAFNIAVPQHSNSFNANQVLSISLRWLPFGISEAFIQERFSLHGRVTRVDLFAYQSCVEALVMFAHWKEAERAVNAEGALCLYWNNQAISVQVQFCVPVAQPVVQPMWI